MEDGCIDFSIRAGKVNGCEVEILSDIYGRDIGHLFWQYGEWQLVAYGEIFNSKMLGVLSVLLAKKNGAKMSNWREIKCQHCGAMLGYHSIPTGMFIVGGHMATRIASQCIKCMYPFLWDIKNVKEAKCGKVRQNAEN